MNIFFLTETESGCYRWRGAIPAKYLRRRGHNVQVLSDDFQAYEAPDVMVIFRAHYPTANKIVEWCKQRNIRVVFDTDDALDRVPRENVHYRELQGRLDLYHFLLEHADVRIVSATHRNLKQLVSGGSFREDLYYRLSVLTLEMP